MRTLWFIVPAHGRHEIARVCYRQLRRTCDALATRGITAHAVIVSDDENLELAHANGFSTVERNNDFLGRRMNDGYELAGREGVEFMVPLGNDDWVDPQWIRLPDDGETTVTHLSSVVNEECTRLAYLYIPFGDGVRVYSRATLERVGFRPADEDRNRAIDASTHGGVRDTAKLVWHDTHPLCIVDFKSSENLNAYDGCARQYGHGSYRRWFKQPHETRDVWERLGEVYPAAAIREMQALHDRGLVAA